MKASIFSHISGFCLPSVPALFLWENTAEEFVQLPLLSALLLTLFIHPYFFPPLSANTTIPKLKEVKENMTMGTTLVTSPDGGFLVRATDFLLPDLYKVSYSDVFRSSAPIWTAYVL